MKRTWVLAGLFLLTAAVILGARVGGNGTLDPHAFHGTLIDPPLPSSDFELATPAGTFQSSVFRGRIVVLVFGFTACPDACPGTLARLARAVDLLERAAEDVEVVLITVDPERDTPERTAEYAAAFNPRFAGLSGTASQVARVASSFGIFHERAHHGDDSDYLVDHTTTVTVLDRRGDVRLLWSSDVTAEQMAEDLGRLLRRS